MSKNTIIECKNLQIAYDGRPAVEDVSLTIDEGDFMSILGKNGSGKSTLMKAILGLKKVSEGSINYFGTTSNQIGYLPQQTVIQRDFPATVYEVVLSGCLNKSGIWPFYSATQKNIAHSNMEKLGVLDLSKKSYRALSGGQQQRVLLARALCATEKMLLLDEPVTGLDPVAQSDFYQILQHLNQKHDITVLMITHDINNALAYSNKILELNGTVAFLGTRDDYFATDLCRQMVGGASLA